MVFTELQYKPILTSTHYCASNGSPYHDVEPFCFVHRGMEYSFYQWHRRHPWSYTTADKEAINLMRHVVLCLHFISMILDYYLPDLKPLPECRPLRPTVSTVSDLLRLPETASEQDATVVNGTTTGMVNVESVRTGADAQARSRMCRLVSPGLKERFIRQVSFRFLSFSGKSPLVETWFLSRNYYEG